MSFGLVATVVLGGGGAWLMRVFKGKKADPKV